MSLALQLELHPPPVAAGPEMDFPRRRLVVARGRMRRQRRWPAAVAQAGEIDLLVSGNDRVEAADAIARYQLRTRATVVDLAATLGVPAPRAATHLTIETGSPVAEGDLLAERRTLGGLQRRVVRSPITGRLTHVSESFGLAYLQPVPVDVVVNAHLGGTVINADETGVTIEGTALAIAGVAGAGPARWGILTVVDQPDQLPDQAAGTVVACAFTVDERIVQRIGDSGAHALVAAGIAEETIERLGWEELLWPSPFAPGKPAPPLTVVLLGIGSSPPVPATWDALRSLQGRPVSALGAEPGAAPEVLATLDEGAAGEFVSGDLAREEAPGGVIGDAADDRFRPGRPVRITAGPARGHIGTIAGVSEGPYLLASEVRTDVVDVMLPMDVRLRVPRLHVELLP